MAMQLREVLFHMQSFDRLNRTAGRDGHVRKHTCDELQPVTHNPRHFVMEINGADVIKVSMHSE
jgi:hypothetical protein